MGIETLIGAAISIAASVGGALVSKAFTGGGGGGAGGIPVVQQPPAPPPFLATSAEGVDLSAQAQALRLKRGRASTILAGGGDTTGLGGTPAKGGLKTVLGG